MMGKKRRREKKGRKDDNYFANLESMEQDFDKVKKNQNGKNRSKLGKKMRKRLLKEEEVRQKEEEKHKPEVTDRCGFHMVMVYVTDDVKMDKNFLLTSIGNYVEVPFCPLGYFRGSDSVTFYFDSDNKVAEAIQSLDKRIQSPSGELMGIKVTFVKETDFILNCDQLQILKNVIIQRFISSTGLLDLSSLHLDPQFVESNTFVPLSNDRILKQVFLIIKSNMPDLYALDLSNNKLSISNLKLIETLDLNCRSLSAMNLENNNITHVHSLKYLRSFPLKELKLQGNKFNENIRSSSSKYIKSIKKELPFLKVLDGQDLSILKLMSSDLLRSPVFNLNANPSILQNASSASADSSVAVSEDGLKTFLEQYYSLVDIPEKDTLLQAYIPTAKLELKSENPLVPSRVFENQIQIKEFLDSWPATKHDHTSFDLEVMSLSPHEGIIQVRGACLFCEPEISLQFKRTMRIIPYNSGFCCSTDLLEIE